MSVDVECPPLHEIYANLDGDTHFESENILLPDEEPSVPQAGQGEQEATDSEMKGAPDNEVVPTDTITSPGRVSTTDSNKVDLDEVEMHFMHPDAGTPAAIALEANAKLKVSKFDKGMRKIRGIKHPKLKKFKRKKEGMKFSRNFKGKTIEGIHEQYTLTIGMMLGIRVAVSC